MMNALQVEELVQRITREVVRAVLGSLLQQGFSAEAQAHLDSLGGTNGLPEKPAPKCCQVGKTGCPCGKAEPVVREHPGRLLTEAGLDGLTAGSRLLLRPGTLVTPLARDRARDLRVDLCRQPNSTTSPSGPISTRVAFFTDQSGPAAETVLRSIRSRSDRNAMDCRREAGSFTDPMEQAVDCARRVASGQADQAVILAEEVYPLLRRLRAIPGLRPVLARDMHSAVAARRDFNGNVLVLPSRRLGSGMAGRAVLAWLEAEGTGR